VTETAQTAIAASPSGSVDLASRWSARASAALRETLSTFGIEASELGSQPLPPTGLAGAYIPLVAPTAATEIGLVCGAGSRGAIARAMLGMSDEEELAEDDEVSCLCEVVNIVAGLIKRAAPAEGEAFALGLPFYVEGVMRTTRASTTNVARFGFGTDEVHLVVTVGEPGRSRRQGDAE
jgi:hypothetical protein